MKEVSKKSFIKRTVGISALIGGLCCFTPVVLVLFGLSTVTFAASLSDTLYGSYKWVFRSAALLFLSVALGWYFYKKEGICSLDQVKRKQNKIINMTLLVFSSAILIYIIWLYVIVEAIGLSLGIW